MGLQRVRRDWATNHSTVTNQSCLSICSIIHVSIHWFSSYWSFIFPFFHLLFFLFTYCCFIQMLQKICQIQSNSILNVLKHISPPFHFLAWAGCFLSLLPGFCPGSFFCTFCMLDCLFSCLFHWLTPLQWYRTYSSNFLRNGVWPVSFMSSSKL